MTTIAGDGSKSCRGDGGPAARAILNGMHNVADDWNGSIRKCDPRTKMVATVLGRGRRVPPLQRKHPRGVCSEKGQLHVVDPGNNRVLRLVSPPSP